MRSSSSAEPQATHAGFTRVELLVILACLTLLALAQLPLLGKSREGGHEAVCMNNLRQLGLAMLMYGNENQDVVPEEGDPNKPITDPANADAWYNLAVQPRYPKLRDLYLSGTVPLPQNGSVYSCPSCPPPRLADGYNFPPTIAKAFFMYAENARICINKATRVGGLNTKFSSIPQPRDTILLAEQNPRTATLPAASVTTGYYAVGRHQGLDLSAMTDGHARSAQTNEFLRTAAEANSAAVEWATPRTMYWYPTATTPN
jgi:type II secretory pathway pseudopilin PulG